MVRKRARQRGISRVESQLSLARNTARRRPRHVAVPPNSDGRGGGAAVATASLARAPRRMTSPTNFAPSIAGFGGHCRTLLPRRWIARRSRVSLFPGRADRVTPHCSPVVSRHSRKSAARRSIGVVPLHVGVGVLKVWQIFPARPPLPWHQPLARSRCRVPQCRLLPIPMWGMMAAAVVASAGLGVRRSAGPPARSLVRSGSMRRRRSAFSPPPRRPRLMSTSTLLITAPIATQLDKRIGASHPPPQMVAPCRCAATAGDP